MPPESCAPPQPVVDSALLAAKIAAVRDATARVRAVLPNSADAFAADRTAREVVVFAALARHGLIPRELATRLAAAAAFRNLVAHQYGALDWRRVYALASSELGDLDVFCATLAERAT